MAKVIFEVGVSHPLYNKVVEAKIITRSGGYNGKCIEAETLEEVYHPSDPKGIICFDNFCNIIGYKERKAFSEIWKGWVKEIVEDDVPNNFNTTIYDFVSGKVIVDTIGEEHPYYKGEVFHPIGDDGYPNYKVVFASVIRKGHQVVAAIACED